MKLNRTPQGNFSFYFSAFLIHRIFHSGDSGVVYEIESSLLCFASSSCRVRLFCIPSGCLQENPHIQEFISYPCAVACCWYLASVPPRLPERDGRIHRAGYVHMKPSELWTLLCILNWYLILYEGRRIRLFSSLFFILSFLWII